jgi:glucose/arabinose dehydrogenase
MASWLSACLDGGSGGSAPAAQTSASISGTVSGTRIVAMNDSDQIVVQDDTAGRAPTAPGQSPFTIPNLPVGPNLRLFFVSNGTVYPFYVGTSNVFAFTSGGPIAVGFVTMNPGTGRATPEFPPPNVTDKPENPNIPPGLVPGAEPVVSLTSPGPGASVPVGPVTVTFAVQSHTIGNPGMSHVHFYLDNDPVPYHFYGGNGITEDNGVLYNDVHTHFVHWKTASSFDIFGLSSGSHQVRLVLAEASHAELTHPDATVTQAFTVQSPPSGDLQLQSVLTGLNFPVGLAQAQDGRVFFNERLTGNIRIIDQQWQLVNTVFCQISVASSAEQGLLGLTLDPNFAQNHFVYVYYTVAGATMNRVARYTDSGGLCTQETVILDNLPVNSIHNGGIVQFGPDGKLYVVIGDAGSMANPQSLTSLAGKILRVNPDGSPPGDNPFFSNANANAKKVYGLGHRNSYGFAFHAHTGHLWETENGPADNDEINRVVAGGNYGWPTVRGIANTPGFLDPTLAFVSVIAPTGIISIPENTVVYPSAYRNNLLFGAWNDGRIRRVILSGTNLTALGSTSTAYNGGNGGLLSFMLGRDGYVYVSNASTIFRVVPQ